MPNLAGRALPYLKGLGAKAGLYASEAGWAGLIGLSKLGKMAGTTGGRTMIGAGLGAAVGAYRGDDYSLSRMAGYGLAGAGLARYGGVGINAFRSQGGMKAVGHALSRKLGSDGAAAGRFIANTAVKANQGYGKFKAMGGFRGAYNYARAYAGVINSL